MMFLLACHVFQSLEIPCTAGQRCAGGDTDSVPVTDSDSDSAPTSSVGVALAMTRGAASEVRIYDATGTQTAVWSGLTFSGVGPLAYDPATGVAYLSTATGYARLATDTTSITSDLLGPYVDVDLLAGNLVLATPDALAFAVPETGVVTQRSTAAYVNLSSVATGASVGWAVDLQSDAANLIQITGSGFSMSAAGYDDNENRSRAVFVGADNAVLVCSARGIVYGVDALAAGDTAPVAVCDAALTDVEDCGYDLETDQFLVFSPTQGVWVMGLTGACTQHIPALDGYTVVGSYFYR